jgi:hypothetical protein
MALTGNISISPTSVLRVYDQRSRDDSYAVTGIEIDDALTLMIGPGFKGDEAVVEACDRLAAAIEDVRRKAVTRIAAARVTELSGIPETVA